MYCKPEKELSQIALRRIFEEAFSDRGPALEFFYDIVVIQFEPSA
jgi:hypothetical protein